MTPAPFDGGVLGYALFPWRDYNINMTCPDHDLGLSSRRTPEWVNALMPRMTLGGGKGRHADDVVVMEPGHNGKVTGLIGSGRNSYHVRAAPEQPEQWRTWEFGTVRRRWRIWNHG